MLNVELWLAIAESALTCQAAECKHILGICAHTHTQRLLGGLVGAEFAFFAVQPSNVHNFCNTLRDLRAIIKAFRGTTPIIHMMSTGKCLQRQGKDCRQTQTCRQTNFRAAESAEGAGRGRVAWDISTTRSD